MQACDTDAAASSVFKIHKKLHPQMQLLTSWLRTEETARKHVFAGTGSGRWRVFP
jgi:hypothetical protein